MEKLRLSFAVAVPQNKNERNDFRTIGVTYDSSTIALLWRKARTAEKSLILASIRLRLRQDTSH